MGHWGTCRPSTYNNLIFFSVLWPVQSLTDYMLTVASCKHPVTFVPLPLLFNGRTVPKIAPSQPHLLICMVPWQGWARDVKNRDRDGQISRRDRDETFVGHDTSPRRWNRPRPRRYNDCSRNLIFTWRHFISLKLPSVSNTLTHSLFVLTLP